MKNSFCSKISWSLCLQSTYNRYFVNVRFSYEWKLSGSRKRGDGRRVRSRGRRGRGCAAVMGLTVSSAPSQRPRLIRVLPIRFPKRRRVNQALVFLFLPPRLASKGNASATKVT